MREVVIDTETTGLSFDEGHKIVEIGCIELINHIPTGSQYHQYINPQRDIPDASFKIHGYTREFLSKYPLFLQIADSFLEFVADSPLIGHNIKFDTSFINGELKSTKNKQILTNDFIDTLAIAKRHFPGNPNSLDALCKRFKIDLSKRTKHSALVDAQLLADVYIELMGGKQTSLSLTKEESSINNTAYNIKKNSQIKPRERSNRLTVEEIKQHAQFIESLGPKALWLKSKKSTNI